MSGKFENTEGIMAVEFIESHLLASIAISLKRIASAIEARSDATGTGAAEGESAVPTADAQGDPA